MSAGVDSEELSNTKYLEPLWPVLPTALAPLLYPQPLFPVSLLLIHFLCLICFFIPLCLLLSHLPPLSLPWMVPFLPPLYYSHPLMSHNE